MYKLGNTKNGVTLILFKDATRREIFLIKRTDYPVWVSPGGGIEDGETPRQAVLREATEETGFKIRILRELGVYLIREKKGLRKTFLYEGICESGEYRPEFPGNIGRCFNVDRLPFSTTKSTRQKIIDSISYSKYFKKELNSNWKMENLHLFLAHPLATIRLILK